MDKIDRNILAYLERDADITNAALAEKVNLSPSSCLRRVQRLKKDGVIQKTVCIIDDRMLGRKLKAIVEVDLERHGTHAQGAFIEKVRQETAVAQAYAITGESDVLMIMNLEDMEEYQKICDRLFNHDKNVIRFRTSFAMEVIKE
ncbi:Transcriptional regulator [Candidatus Terasakiella magnetica]|uniref:Transcriptional regulator n=1 Tax=Candidatus Terasakiella magnetica TaxID=1867952 RepID=A0A1C3RDC3_9PROT|nr:Lrp/AsnC family transcriptional regulator [Candidatus Terasakiella magnetica]SCA55231.1 Transcriptional regulator [Candidatus Terasakiella magnetica]